jgi:hypothetical protein
MNVRAFLSILTVAFALLSSPAFADRLSSFRLGPEGVTIDDKNSGLMWQRSGKTFLTWGRAVKYCRDLELAGFGDWRLPQSAELMTLVDTGKKNPSLSTTYFPDTKPSGFWTATTGSKLKFEGAWYVNFYAGTEHYGVKTYEHYVRCVRGRMRIR